MESLAHYVAAILQNSPEPVITRHETQRQSWIDQGYEVKQQQSTYWFANGVVIRREQEQDSFPSAELCAECWICYQVLEHGPRDKITPERQTFASSCREQFWLADHCAP